MTGGQTPVLRVVNPDATPEEVAAIVAILTSRRAPATATRTTPSAWSAPTRAHRRPVADLGGWRGSCLPR